MVECFPTAGDGDAPIASEVATDDLVEFDGDEEAKPISGRRKKAARDKQKKFKPGSFETMGLSIPILKAIKRKGYTLPTPIQRKTIPLILQGMDVVGMARTGSGKTAAFVIPILEKLKEHRHHGGARGVFLAPTRELTLQTYKVITEIGAHTDLVSAVLVGGDSMEAQFAELSKLPDMLVATPGRLLHHLTEVPNFNLRSVQHIVLDEADRLFEMGLGEQVREIIMKASDSRQTLLFSATMPAAVAEFARAGLRAPELVRLDTDTKISPDLALAFFTLRHDDKPAALVQLVQDVLPPKSPTIIFTATKYRVEYLSLLFEAEGIPCAAVYGSMDQTARKISVARFRNGKVHVLIVTDVAARGIDIPLLDNVINYDFIAKPKLFVHRAGRAARAGRTGTAYSFLTTDEVPYLIDLHLFLSRPLRAVPADCYDDDEQYKDASVSWLGSYPDTMMDLALENIREVVATNPSIHSLETSCANAFRLYQKTRPPASSESVKRAKAFGREGPHPLLLAVAAEKNVISVDVESAKKDFTLALKNFRPAATVLEAQVAAGRAGKGTVQGLHASGPSDRKMETMRLKRKAHELTIQKTQEEAQHRRAAASAGEDIAAAGRGKARARLAHVGIENGVGTGRFQDAEFFIQPTKAGEERYADEGYSMQERGHNAISHAVLDLNADDGEGMQQQQRRIVWDKKSKKYVQLQKNEVVKAGKRVKTESGAKVKATERTGEMFKKWVKRTGGKADVVKGAQGGKSALAERFEHGGRGWSNPVSFKRANSNIKDDMKSEGEMRKIAKKKDRQREHLKTKGGGVKKKGGKKGGAPKGKRR